MSVRRPSTRSVLGGMVCLSEQSTLEEAKGLDRRGERAWLAQAVGDEYVLRLQVP